MTRACRLSEKSATFIYFYLLTGAKGRTGADGAERKKGVVDALVGEIQLRLKAINEHGGFGKWSWAVSRQPGDLIEILRPTHGP